MSSSGRKLFFSVLSARVRLSVGLLVACGMGKITVPAGGRNPFCPRFQQNFSDREKHVFLALRRCIGRPRVDPRVARQAKLLVASWMQHRIVAHGRRSGAAQCDSQQAELPARFTASFAAGKSINLTRVFPALTAAESAASEHHPTTRQRALFAVHCVLRTYFRHALSGFCT